MNTLDRFWNITAQGRTAEIDISGVIGDIGLLDEESTTATDFVRELRNLRGVSKLNINIHSEGGSIRDGMAIYRAIRDFPGEKVAHVPALAGSIATVIGLAADRVEVAPEAYWVIHNPRGMAVGEAIIMQHAADVLNKSKGAILDIYERRTGADRDHLSEMMDAETWLLGDEIKEAGFADVVKKDQPKMRVAAQIAPEMVALMKHVPDSIASHAASSSSRWARTTRSDVYLRRKPAPLPKDVAERLAKLRGAT